MQTYSATDGQRDATLQLSPQVSSLREEVALLRLSVESHGVRIVLAAESEQMLAQMCAHLPPGAQVSNTPRETTARRQSVNAQQPKQFTILEDTARSGDASEKIYELYAGVTLLTHASGNRIGEIFESQLQIHVAEHSPEFVFIHAGVIGWRGRAVLFPGDSMSGKTTLVTELVRRGADYFSDEYALLDKDGRVHPFPKSPAVRERVGSKRQTVRPIEFFGGKAIGTDVSLPVALVLACEYRPDATWHAHKLSAGCGALRLLRHTVSARRQPDIALQTLAKISSTAPVFEATRGAAHASVEQVFKLLESLDEQTTI